MDLLRVDVKLKPVITIFLLVFCISQCSLAWNHEYLVDHSSGKDVFDIRTLTLDHDRQRRSVPPSDSQAAPAAQPVPVGQTPSETQSGPVGQAPPAAQNAPTTPPAAVITVPPSTQTNITDDSNRTTNVTQTSSLAPVSVTQIPLLGANGTGIFKGKLTKNTPKVSDPIVPDDNFADIFKETPERIKSEQNLTALSYDSHEFYNSTFIGNLTYFNNHWDNINSPKAQVHAILSNSHRRATTVQLSFDFPFYGHYIRNITVATGGFIYTGEHVHNWLAATQYIAPLMGNFDTSVSDDSNVKLYDDGEKFTAFWENVTLQEDLTKKFTFAVTLYKSGDIVFAYKHIPIDVKDINDTEHPVKVGISDAYINDNIIIYVRHKTIYEYHRVSFKNHLITNNTILYLTALPTCLQYNTCDSCLNHETGFNCTWCPQIQKCSSGTDRNRQNWKLRNCDKTTITEASRCAALPQVRPAAESGDGTAYTTDQQAKPHHDAIVNTLPEEQPAKQEEVASKSITNAAVPAPAGTDGRSSMNGVIGAFVAITLVCGAAAWVLYAFKNPHTRSGQLLIKYRPTQWSWRRGEARYTAATIHM